MSVVSPRRANVARASVPTTTSAEKDVRTQRELGSDSIFSKQHYGNRHKSVPGGTVATRSGLTAANERSSISGIVIAFIFLLTLLLALIIFLYLASTRNFATVGETTNLTIDCLAGQCATNIVSGEKICPARLTDVVSVNPANQVCNSPFTCDNPLTPFAVQSDGSTNIQGVCEPGVECPCVTEQCCPNFVLSAFTATNGNPYQAVGGQRILFPQTAVYSAGAQSSDTPPLQFANPSTTFCTVPLAWLPLANPGCTFAAELAYADIVTCMGLAPQGTGQPGCSPGVTYNPCLQGTLAFISDDSSSMTQADINVTQLGCVRGEPCPCGQVAIYDTNLNGVVCRVLS